MYSANVMPTKAYILSGVMILASLPLSVRAFRVLSAAVRQHLSNGCGTKRSGLQAVSSSSVAGGKTGTVLDLAGMRENYVSVGIDEKSVPSAPHKLMAKWIEDACNCKEVIEPNAMCLSTVGEDGRPSARFVLMKGYSEEGVTWYTNYNSRKAKELVNFPHAAITFWWGALSRSVRFEGTVSKISAEESDAYYSSRPTGSKIGAWVSDQSELIGSREELNQKAAEMEQSFASNGDDVPRPPHWGGFQLRPRLVEFWEGQPSRLHDRIVYSRSSPDGEGPDAGDEWTISRLQP